MTPVISIIIPCYNSGMFLPEAIQSVEDYKGVHKYEVIIVDDGSTDEPTLLYLKELQSKSYTVLHQENKGPGAARNAGVAIAKGEYLLFLDSDNKIRSSYIDKGIDYMTKHADVGVVYGKPFFFGDRSTATFTVKAFALDTILGYNYIDVCAVVRKEAFVAVGGFDESRLVIGYEDWELWISIGATKWKFYFMDEVLYEYRLRKNSLIQSKKELDTTDKLMKYVYTKHIDLFIKHYTQLFHQYQFYQNDKKRPFRSFLKYIKEKHFTQ